ncbi:MAG: hypothetical protein ABI220_04850 [Candidatus Saccharimonadales bacterium]
MASNKHFLQDRAALLLVGGNTFLAFVAVLLVLLKLNATQGAGSYIISYRPSLGIDVYKSGTVWDIMSFVGFALLAYVIGITLSYKTHKIKRELSLVILALTLTMLVFLIVVANALLVLR